MKKFTTPEEAEQYLIKTCERTQKRVAVEGMVINGEAVYAIEIIIGNNYSEYLSIEMFNQIA